MTNFATISVSVIFLSLKRSQLCLSRTNAISGRMAGDTRTGVVAGTKEGLGCWGIWLLSVQHHLFPEQNTQKPRGLRESKLFKYLE